MEHDLRTERPLAVRNPTAFRLSAAPATFFQEFPDNIQLKVPLGEQTLEHGSGEQRNVARNHDHGPLVLGEERLGFTQLAALYVLADAGTTTVSDLADALGRSASATSRPFCWQPSPC